MKENRTVAKWFAGLMMVGTIVVGGFTPAQAADTGWGGTVAPADGTSVTTTTTTPTEPTTTTPTTITVIKTNVTAKDTGWGGT
jgi:multidrug efflux pump subunit AcrA (membrane-fusion protein)